MHQHLETGLESQARPAPQEPSAGWREQRFAPKEVSEILSIATRLQSEGVKGEQILQMAEEAGIAPEYVERAVMEFLKRKWQRVEAELAMRRRLRRILLAGALLIATVGSLALWGWLESRGRASYADSASPPPYEFLVPRELPYRLNLGTGVYAASQNLSVSAKRTANEFGQTLTDVTLWRRGSAEASRVQIPSHSIAQISIAPNEQRVALVDAMLGAVWLVNADGTGLNRVAEFNTPLTLPNGEVARATRQPFAGWDGDDLILHTDKGSMRVRLSKGNTVTKVEPYKP